MREDPTSGVYVEGLTEHEVDGPDGVLHLIHESATNRATCGTAMNRTSSRSHALLFIRVEQAEGVAAEQDPAGEAANPAADTAAAAASAAASKAVSIKRGLLTIVDLAGSERVCKSGSDGQRLEEAKRINRSIAALGNCIAALGGSGVGRAAHVPFRDSKLTRLLTDSLGGNTKTSLCASVGPALHNYDETFCTLLLATRAMCVKTVARVNERIERPDAAAAPERQALLSQMRALQSEVLRLRKESSEKGPANPRLAKQLSRDLAGAAPLQPAPSPQANGGYAAHYPAGYPAGGEAAAADGGDARALRERLSNLMDLRGAVHPGEGAPPPAYSTPLPAAAQLLLPALPAMPAMPNTPGMPRVHGGEKAAVLVAAKAVTNAAALAAAVGDTNAATLAAAAAPPPAAAEARTRLTPPKVVEGLGMGGSWDEVAWRRGVGRPREPQGPAQGPAAAASSANVGTSAPSSPSGAPPSQPPPPPQQQQQTSAQPSAPEPPAHSAALPSGVRIHGAENVSSEVLASLVGRAKLAGAQVTARSEADAESSVGGDVAAELAATSELQGTGDLVLDQLVSGLLATPCIRKRLDQLYGRAPSRSSSQINVAQLDNTGVNSLSDYRGYNLPSSPLLGGALTESQRSSLAGGGHEPHDDEPSL